MKSEFTPRKSRLSRAKHVLSFHERLWQRIDEVARQHYGGNRSRAIEGFVVHDWIVQVNKEKKGETHTHWISAPAVLNEGELEPLLERLERGDADAVGCYVDRLVEERARAMAAKSQGEPPTEPPGQNT